MNIEQITHELTMEVLRKAPSRFMPNTFDANIIANEYIKYSNEIYTELSKRNDIKIIQK